MEYNFLKGLKKGVISAVIFAVPIVLTSFPAWADITVGGILMILVNWLKIRYKLL